MSDSSLYSDYIMTRQRVDQLERIESGRTYLTLSRNANLTISTAGTIVTWQDEVRNLGFTWSGTDITIPSSGYYAVALSVRKSSATTTIRAFLSLSGTRIIVMPEETSSSSTITSFYMMRYFSATNVLNIELLASASVTMQVTAYNETGESPFLHIVKV